MEKIKLDCMSKVEIYTYLDNLKRNLEQTEALMILLGDEIERLKEIRRQADDASNQNEVKLCLSKISRDVYKRLDILDVLQSTPYERINKQISSLESVIGLEE